MKKVIAVLTVLCVIFLVSCKGKPAVEESTSFSGDELTASPEVTTVESITLEEIEPAKVIAVYFSVSDSVGVAAEYIQEKTACAIHKIETLREYPTDEKELLAAAAEEHKNNVRPALKNAPADLRDYDIVFLCFPIWDGTMPMALFTFLEDYDMREKIVIPVVHGNQDGLNNAIRDINGLFSTMIITNGFCLGDDFLSQQKTFEQWFTTVLYG